MIDEVQEQANNLTAASEIYRISGKLAGMGEEIKNEVNYISDFIKHNKDGYKMVNICAGKNFETAKDFLMNCVLDVDDAIKEAMTNEGESE